VLLFAGCAQAPQKSDATAAPAIKDAAAAPPPEAKPAPVIEKKPDPNLPKEYLSNEILYEFMLGEVAAQRGNSVLAAQAYIDLAHRTRDPRIAARALELAYVAHMPDAAIEAAHIWLTAEPDSDDAVRRLAGLLISTNKIDEARPYLQRILSGDEGSRAQAFMQLNQLFAANPDRAENLRVVQELAKPYPELPEAHFAIAQAALAASEQDLALTEIRNAMKLRPHWDIGVLGEAQLLQKSEGAAAARKRLASYLQAYPDAREVRLNYARVLVADRDYAEARNEFERLLKQNPANTDVLFAVAVLSVQLEDYDRAEDYFKQLLKLDYKDPDNVRLYLGQIAEERERYPEALMWYRGITGEEHKLSAQIRQAQC
jgi:tetratricopeptide (TPR) repeat protein